MWVYSPHRGGKTIPPGVKLETERRILEHAARHHAGKFTRVEARFRGAFCYIDAYTPLDISDVRQSPIGETRQEYVERLRNTPTHLCRLRYFGDESKWGFAFYSYAHEKYEPSVLLDGSFRGTPEEAFDTSTLFY
jgi:hypothetical protein